MRQGPGREEIASIFASASGEIDSLILRAGLTPEQEVVFRRSLWIWFDACARRLGGEDLPVESFRSALLNAARTYVGDFREGCWVVSPDAESDDRWPDPGKEH